MASKNIHTAVLPNGKTETRTSASGRHYTHAVATRDSYEKTLAAAKSPDHAKHDTSNWNHAKNCASVEAGARYPDPRYSFTVSASMKAEGEATLAAHPTAASYVAAKQAERVAKVEERKAAGGFEAWGVMCWNSREDLSRKEAATALANAYRCLAEAIVIPVTMETKAVTKRAAKV